MFSKNSPLVQAWVRLITGPNAIYTIDDVPELSNLKDVVEEIVSKNE